mgnify:FL=1
MKLTKNHIESELSIAYVHAVAAKAGFATEFTRVDVDITIGGPGLISTDSTLHSPQIAIQLKATINKNVNGDGSISFNLPLKNYDDLRANCLVPKILVVLFLPKEENIWLSHSIDQLIIKECAYWLSIKGFTKSDNASHQTVRIPSANVFSPETISGLLIKVSKEEDL